MDKILIIDDSKVVIKKLVQILNKEYAVFPLTSSENALEMAAFIKPSLILLDIIMPRITGYDIIKQLKQNENTAEIPVIFLSSLDEPYDEEKGLLLGAVDYITKPISEGIVKARIRTHINLYNKTRNESIALNRTYLGATDAALFDFDYINHTLNFSKSFASKFDIPDFFENFPESFLHNTDIVPHDQIEYFKTIIADITKGSKSSHECEVSFKLPNGNIVWYSLYYNTIFKNSGEPWRVIGMMDDITNQKTQKTEPVFCAEFDHLTKLLNGDVAKKQIEKCLTSNKLKELHALIVVDIDNFKTINDNLGHQFGDTIMQEIGFTIKKVFRESDITGRLGSDEFVILMRCIKDEGEALSKARDLCEAFRYTYIGEFNEYIISASLGIAFSNSYFTTFDELFPHAESAMYHSKCRGKDRFTVYSEDMINECADVSTLLDESYRFISKYYSEELSYCIFEMLYETKDFKTTINTILGIIGKKYYLDSVRIYEYDQNMITMNLSYAWSKEKSEFQKPSAIKIAKFHELFDNFDADGIFLCNDVTHFDKSSIEMYALENIKSFLLSAMYDSCNMKGFICFSDFVKHRVWSGEEIATLGYISRIISVFLSKRKLEKQT